MQPNAYDDMRTRLYEMATHHDAPTAEQVADTAGGDVESAERALLAVRFRNSPPE